MRAHLAVPLVAALLLAGCDGEDDDNATPDLSAPLSDPVSCEEEPVDLAEADPAVRITSYESLLTIADEGGGLAAQETLTVDFDDSDHHGIFRDFSGEDFSVSDATGTLDGAPSGFFGAGRLTLGDADVTLPAGEHEFGISYEADAVLEPATDVDQDWQFDAAVIEQGWALDIADAEITIQLPAEAGYLSCVTGLGTTASIAGGGTSTLVVTADKIPAGTGLRVLVGLDADPYE